MPSLGLVAVLGLGGLRVLDGSLTIGELVAFNFFVTLLVWPLRSIGMTVAFAQRAAAALERVHEVLDVAPAIADPPEPVDLADWRWSGEFSSVTFGYSDSLVLDGFDLEIAAGESVAVVGATGSGKSTVARLLLRFYDPSSGSITIDGVDLRDLRVDDVRRAVGIVFEDTLLFNDTVSANIAFAVPGLDPSADRERIRSAARAAGADEFIERLPEGYDTVLGERGFSLSGGQRQRIAIARAVLADPRVLVLDDATSAVDPSKEHEIRSAMGVVMRDRTTIVIAHRPGTVAMADRVILVDGGRVAASGPHAELLESNARYREVLAADSARSAAGGELMWGGGAVAPEDRLDGAATRRVIRRAARLGRPFRRTMLGAVGFVAMATSATIAGPLLVRHGIDSGIRVGDRAQLGVAIVGYLVAVTVAFVGSRGQYLLVNRAGEGLRELRLRLFAHIQRQSLGFFDENKAGVLVARMTADIESMSELVQWGLAPVRFGGDPSRGRLGGAALAVVAAHPRGSPRVAGDRPRVDQVPTGFQRGLSRGARTGRREPLVDPREPRRCPGDPGVGSGSRAAASLRRVESGAL